MKKAPLFILILSSSLLFSIFGYAGRNDIYDYQDRNMWTDPYFKGMFMGFTEGEYPWVLYDDDVRAEAREVADARKQKEAELKAREEEENTVVIYVDEMPESKKELQKIIKEAEAGNLPESSSEAKATVSATPTPTPEPTYTPRYAPLRESTYDEYVNHISADIYGSDGVDFALGYDGYKSVTEDYFDSALFIGDSRTVGLRDYTDLSSHAQFLAQTSLTIWKVFKSDFNGKGTVEEMLDLYSFDKIYLMVGVNELGTGTTEDFMKEYTAVVDKLRELSPDSIIYIQAIMNVDKEKSNSDAVFNNVNILGRNNAIATLADNENIFYLDINESVCDEEGYLREDLRGDHLHLKGASNKYWKEFLMDHAVIRDSDKKYVTDVKASDRVNTETSAPSENPSVSPESTPTPTPTATPTAKATKTPEATPVPTQSPAEATDVPVTNEDISIEPGDTVQEEP